MGNLGGHTFSLVICSGWMDIDLAITVLFMSGNKFFWLG